MPGPAYTTGISLASRFAGGAFTVDRCRVSEDKSASFYVEGAPVGDTPTLRNKTSQLP